eukprot:Selendium_serpulae@DN5346_c0_g1_i1.p1
MVGVCTRIHSGNIGGESPSILKSCVDSSQVILKEPKPLRPRVKRRVTWSRETLVSRSDSLPSSQASTAAGSTDSSDDDNVLAWTPPADSPSRHLSGKRRRSVTREMESNSHQDHNATAAGNGGGGNPPSEAAPPRYNTRRSTRARRLPCEIDDSHISKDQKRVVIVNGLHTPVKKVEKEYRLSLTTGLEEMMRMYGVDVESGTGQIKSWRHPSASEVKDAWTRRTQERLKLIAEANEECFVRHAIR